jgi:type II secretory pathway pseudopilin PulG
MPLISCPECNKEVSEGAIACPNCGNPIASKRSSAPPVSVPSTPSPPLLHPQPTPAPRSTSGLAVTSLVLGIFSLFSLGLTGIPAVICGHIARSNIKKSSGTLSGDGLAIAGLVTGYFGFLFIGIAVLAGIALPVFSSVQDRAAATKCLSNAQQIALSCRLYASDHDGNYPQTLEQLVPDYLPDNHIFTCPITKDATTVGYEYFGGTDTDPPNKVLLTSKATTRDHKRVVVYVDSSGILKRD